MLQESPWRQILNWCCAGWCQKTRPGGKYWGIAILVDAIRLTLVENTEVLMFWLTLSLTAYFLSVHLTACVPVKTYCGGRLLHNNGDSDDVRSVRSGLHRELREAVRLIPPPAHQHAKVNVYSTDKSINIKYDIELDCWYFIFNSYIHFPSLKVFSLLKGVHV